MTSQTKTLAHSSPFNAYFAPFPRWIFKQIVLFLIGHNQLKNDTRKLAKPRPLVFAAISTEQRLESVISVQILVSYVVCHAYSERRGVGPSL